MHANDFARASIACACVCVVCAARVQKRCRLLIDEFARAASHPTSLHEKKSGVRSCIICRFALDEMTKCRERKSRKSTSKECMRKRSCTRRRSMRQRTNAFHMPWNLLTACMCCVADARRAPNDVDRFTSCLTDANELDARDQCSFISRD